MPLKCRFEPWGSQDIGYHPRIREQELFFCRFVIKTLFCGFTPELVKSRAFFEMKSFFLYLYPRIRENPRIFWDEDLFFGAHSRIQSINFLFSLKICLCPPSHAILAPRMTCRSQKRFLRYSPEMLALSRTNNLLTIWSQTVPSLRGARGPCPPNDCLCLPI